MARSIVKQMINCPADLFTRLAASAGNHFSSDGEDYSFLYDAFGQSEFTDLVSIYIPDLSDAVFNSWEEFEYWCDDIESGLIWLLVDEEELADGDLGAAPREYFGSKSTVEQKVIEALCDGERDGLMSVACAEVSLKGEVLFLIFDDFTGWGLGHADSVLVVRSLDELVPDKGFYPIL